MNRLSGNDPTPLAAFAKACAGLHLQVGDQAWTDFNGDRPVRVTITGRRENTVSQSGVMFQVDTVLRNSQLEHWYDAGWFWPVTDKDAVRASGQVDAPATRLDQALGNRVFYNLPHPYTLGRVIVYGEGEMGWYDYVLVDSEGLIETRSNLQYGSAEIALRDALIIASDFAGAKGSARSPDGFLHLLRDDVQRAARGGKPAPGLNLPNPSTGD